MPKTGRPKKEFQSKIFENLCFIQCPKHEICSVLDVDNNTLDRMINDIYNDTFSNVYKKYTEVGRMSLRRTQFKLAEKNATLCIWLGKQYLGQRDIIENINNDRVIIVNNLGDVSE